MTCKHCGKEIFWLSADETHWARYVHGTNLMDMKYTTCTNSSKPAEPSKESKVLELLNKVDEM